MIVTIKSQIDKSYADLNAQLRMWKGRHIELHDLIVSQGGKVNVNTLYKLTTGRLSISEKTRGGTIDSLRLVFKIGII